MPSYWPKTWPRSVAGYRRTRTEACYISGLIVVNDAETGFPACVMDAA
jgi:ornithine cyclodeaminase/alanine dehydrogenase-like protein (mu-crystallin family)